MSGRPGAIRGLDEGMVRRVNFADPEYEPTDEDLAALVHEAFADIPAAREQSLREMRARIEAGQAEARERVAALRAAGERR